MILNIVLHGLKRKGLGATTNCPQIFRSSFIQDLLRVFTDFDGLHGFEILLSIKAIVWWYKKLGLGTTLNSSYLYLKWVKIVQSYFYYD